MESAKKIRSHPDPLSTHILDQAAGCAAANVAITLWQQTEDGEWSLIISKHTNNDGRASAFLSWDEFSVGTYKIHFATEDYYMKRGIEPLYPYAEIVFKVKCAEDHFHIPLILSPFGYSTYKGT